MLVVSSVASAVDDWVVTAESGKFYSRNTTPASAVRSQTTFAARSVVPSGPVIYTTREVLYSRATAAKLLRFAASPAGTVTALVLPTFFQWWQSQGKGTITSDGVYGPASSGTCAGASYNFSHSTSHSFTEGIADEKSYYLTGGFCGLKSVSIDSNESIYGLVRRCYDGAMINFPIGSVIGCSAPAGLPVWDLDYPLPPAGWEPVLPASQTVTVSPYSNDDFFGDFETSPFGDDPSSVADIFEDESGRPFSTAEIEAMRKAIRDELVTKAGGDPSSLLDPETGPSLDPSNPDAPSSQPPGWSSVPGGASQDVKLPEACQWFEVHCLWLEWTKEPLVDPGGAPGVPVESLESGGWSSGLGDGSCPSPYVVSALGASVSLSWQPACDFVSMLRPILIAFAGIAAALILLGQRAGGAG